MKRTILVLFVAMMATISAMAEIKIVAQQSWQVVDEADEYLEQENYEMVKKKLYNSNNVYFEGQASNLAIAYTMLGEYKAALELCNALIKFNSSAVNTHYFLRGLIHERMGKYIAAMEDYLRSNYTDYYNSLYQKVFRPYPSPEKQEKLVYDWYYEVEREVLKTQKSHH